MSLHPPPLSADPDPLTREAARLRATGAPFAMATVVRTMAATAARPGARALIDAEGRIVAGFLGGGCVRGAVVRAARACIASGAPQLLSIRPEDLLAEADIAPGEIRDGVLYARNGCPSRGALDIFVEPVLPRPRLLICGDGPVALALAELSRSFEFERWLCLPEGGDGPPEVPVIPGFNADHPGWHAPDFVVIATQGKGDRDALRRALAAGARHVSFVASRRKFDTLAGQLQAEGVEPRALARVQAPAGIDIHAITPEEIALSILAELVRARRACQRPAPDAETP